MSGHWPLDIGLSTLDYHRHWTKMLHPLLGALTMDPGPWTVDFGLWTKDYRHWTIIDIGLWTIDHGLWTLGYHHENRTF